jgi:phosphoheptose isomerase
MPAEAMTAIAEAEFRETEENFRALPKCIPSIVAAADLMIEGLRRGGKIMFCGNGGSAACPGFDRRYFRPDSDR